MTRDEHRANCAAQIFCTMIVLVYPDATDEEANAILDSLRFAGVRVVPITATDRMIDAGPSEHAISFWEAMSAAGDLTNPPREP